IMKSGGACQIIKQMGARSSWGLSAKLLEISIVRWRIIPESCVPRVRHHLNFRVRDARFVLIGGGCLDNRISDAVRNQYRLADLRQKVVIVEQAREQPLTDNWRNRHVLAQPY